MQIDVIESLSDVDILPPEQSEEERERITHQALAESARGLSIDERYVLLRLASVVAQDPKAGISLAGSVINLSVAEFAACTGATDKVARRRLDHAVEALFARTVSIQLADVWSAFRWTEARVQGDDYFELHFSGYFLKYLRYIASGTVSERSLQAFATAVNGPSFAARGFKIPADLSVVLVSRLQARTKRPTGLTEAQLYKRVQKRLKRVLDREGVLDAYDALHAKGPQLNGHKYTKYSHREINRLYDWVMANKDKPDYLEF